MVDAPLREARRLGGVLLGERERAGEDSGVANLPPVVARAHPAGVGQGGVKPAPAQAGRDLLARRLVHVVVEPVVARRDRERHLAHVEEV